MVIEYLCIHTIDISRPAMTRDAAGSIVRRPYQTVRAGVPCRVVPAPGKVTELYRQRGQLSTHCVYFASDPGIPFVEGAEWALMFQGSRFLEVRGTQNPDEMNVYWRVDCEEISQRQQ